MRPHPQGVLPEGNQYLISPEDAAAAARSRAEGLGALARLPDDLILRVLSGGDDDDGAGPSALAALARCSRICRAFAYHEDLWKAAVLTRWGGDFAFVGGSWRTTHAAATARERVGGGDRDDATDAGTRTTADASRGRDHPSPSPSPSSSSSRSPPVFSDALYLRHVAAHLPLDPDWLLRDDLPREDAARLSVEDFVRRFESPNLPVILTGACSRWPAMDGRWSRERMTETHGATRFTVGGYQMSLSDFWRYCDDADDDAKLYLFDKNFVAKAPDLGEAYEPPEFFRDDLFRLLGESARPDYRWLIAGAARSGSSFHKDPNATSAWNAVIRGRKKWILFHPDRIPPGVHPSADGDVVAQPVSLVEWYMNFYHHAREEEEEEDEEDEDERDDGAARASRSKRPRVVPGVVPVPGDGVPTVLEGVCGPGDVLFVPSGWWHMALNLDECVAVTQNFCSPRTLPKTLRFLRDAAECADANLAAELVSGTSRDERGSLYERFLAVLREKRPEVLDPGGAASASAETPGARTNAAKPTGLNPPGRNSKPNANGTGNLAGLFGGGGGEGGGEGESRGGVSFAFNF